MGRHIRIVCLYVCAIALALSLGVLAGGSLGHVWSSLSGAQGSVSEVEFLQENLHGIDNGQEFPELPLWSIDGEAAPSIRDLMPSGGVIVLATLTCDPCVDRLRAIQEAVNQAGNRARAVVVVADKSDGIDSLVPSLRESGIGLPIYLDVPESMRRLYSVRTSMAWFELDDQFVVRSMGIGSVLPGDYKSLIDR